MVNTEHMPSPVGLLLEAHAANVCTWDSPGMRPIGAHALSAFERTLVEVNHGDVSVEAIAECEATIASWALVVSLLQMGDSVVLVCVSTFCEGLIADLAGEWLDAMGGADVR